MAELPLVRGEQLVERGETCGVSRLEPDSLAGPRIDAVRERDLEHLRHVEVAGENIALLAEGPHLDASARPARARVGERFPLPDELSHDHVRVEHGRLPEACPDDARRALDERVGALLAHLDRRARLEQPHLLDHVEHQKGELAHAVGAVLVHAPRVDLGEIGIGAALLGGHSHLRRRRLIVELDPEALEELLGALARERAVREARAVERKEVPVEMPGIERVPRVELGRHAEMREPVVLKRLVEIARGMRGNALADRGDSFELGPPRRIALRAGELARLFGVALGECDEGFRADPHRLELMPFRLRVRIVRAVERRVAALDVLLEIDEALRVDLAIEHGMPRRALLHELGEDSRLVCGFPFGRHLQKQPLTDRFAAPERDDLLFVNFPRLRAHGERNLLARIEEVEILEAVAAELGEGRRRFRRWGPSLPR